MSIPKDAAKARDEGAVIYWISIESDENNTYSSQQIIDAHKAGFDAGFKYQQERVDEIEKQLCGIAPANLIDRYYQSLKALRKFEQLKGALEENYTDDTIVRCEVTAGDIRAVLKCLYPNSKHDAGAAENE